MKTHINYLIVAALTALMALPAMAGVSGSYSSVNNSITIGDNATAGSIESVNGSIRIGANSFVDSVESVNGFIKLGNDVTVAAGIEAVNGAITLGPGCEVGERIETVNGAIRMENTRVAGDVETVNGSIRILDRSEVSGNVLVRKPGGWVASHRQKPLQVEIGQNVIVHGNLVFEHAVELVLHATATVGEIIGDEVTMIDGH